MIEVRNLVKKFGSFKAVNDVSFNIDSGEIFAFLGPNGAGKTTTVRMLATLLEPTSGSVRINGFVLGKDNNKIRSSIGFAMQGITLDLTASAWENLILIGVLYGLSRKDALTKAKELLNLFDLEKFASSWVKNYSGGMRKRLDLAIALIHQPPVIFLDEPTEGLDPISRRKVWNYLKELNEKGTTIFLTTHYMEEADYLADCVGIIDKGKIVAMDSPQELKRIVGGSLEDVFVHYAGRTIRDDEINPLAPDPYINV